jgi:diguanylate cyclase (GGDEF)-like protein
MKTKPTIMIVDDDVSILDILQQSLAMEGFLCEVHTRAKDALEALERRSVDILLTDIEMPGMRGHELVIRAKQIQPSLTAIMMTGFVEEFSYDDVVRSGATDFIKKPFTVQELLVRIKHAKLQDGLRELSITDDLTGLSNRRGFFAFTQKQIKQIRRSNARMVLLYADLDNLKAINDSEGHLAGDRVLSDTAGILRETFRESDIIARMGGDEFAVILVDAPETGMAAVRERLQQHLDEYNARRAGAFKLEMSMGMAVFDPADPRTVDELIREADSCMYDEKQRKKMIKGK